MNSGAFRSEISLEALEFCTVRVLDPLSTQSRVRRSDSNLETVHLMTVLGTF
jgi:hypothetical protein